MLKTDVRRDTSAMDAVKSAIRLHLNMLSAKDKVLYGLIVLFLASMYMPHITIVPNILLGGIALFSFFYNNWRQKMELLRQRPAIILIILFYLLHVVSAFLSENRAAGFRAMVLRLPILAFPVVLGWMYVNQVLKEKILRAYAVITVVAVLFCMIWGLVQYANTQNAALLYNDSLTLVIDKQSIYVAMMVNLAFFSFGYLVHIGAIKKRWWVYASIVILLIAHFLLASRIAIAILYGGVFFYCIKQKKYIPGIAMVAVALLFVVAFPKTLNRFKELTYTHFDYTNHGVESHYNMQVTADQWNGANIRLAVWNCGWELVKQHPVVGMQTGDKMDKLMQVYKTKGFDFAYNSRRNLHNNYLDVLVSFGVIGLLLFVTGFFILPFITLKDVFSRMVLIAFAISLVPETYMDRTFGNYLLAFWVAFVISCYPVRTAR